MTDLTVVNGTLVFTQQELDALSSMIEPQDLHFIAGRGRVGRGRRITRIIGLSFIRDVFYEPASGIVDSNENVFTQFRRGWRSSRNIFLIDCSAHSGRAYSTLRRLEFVMTRNGSCKAIGPNILRGNPRSALKRFIAAATFCALQICSSSIFAQENDWKSIQAHTATATFAEAERGSRSPSTDDSLPVVGEASSIPESLNYLFDLPWCSRWHFSCMSCEKKNGSIECFDRKSACLEQFKFYQCESYNLPKKCVAWRDGCNFCTKSGCTLLPCQEYLAPNKPSFACTKYDSEN
jgi:hypothetical protein